MFLLVLNVLIVGHRGSVGGNYELHLTVTSDKEQEIQVYYSVARELSEKMSQVQSYNQVGESQELVFSVPFQCNMVRLDLGTQPGTFTIQDVYLGCKDVKEQIPEMNDPKLIEGQQIESLESNKGTLKVWTNGNDPYIWLTIDKDQLYPVLEKDYTQKLWIKNILMLLLIDGGAVVAFVFRKKVLTLPIELLQNRKLIMNLAKNDFKTKYAGSYLGIVWAFVQPIVTILVYWFVFSVGLKAGNISDYPFVLYLVSGIVPWFFFQDALNGGTNALMEYNYLVKKVVFKISVLPIVKMISALFVHAFFVVFSLVLCSLYGYTPYSGNTADSVLFVLYVYAYAGTGICNRCDRCIFQRSDTDHQHFLTGRCLADTDHVGCQHVVQLSVADQTVQIKSDVLYRHRIP